MGAALFATVENMELRRFQKTFLKRALAPGVDVAALSLPRGNGKTWLAAHILERCLTPGDNLFKEGTEYILCAASIEQARLCFRFIRETLEPCDEYRFVDSVQRIGITHKPTNTRLRVISSNGKTAMGIVNCPVLVADEPGAWETVGGQLMSDAIETALGKPGSKMRAIYIGTLAPSNGGWWHDLIAGGSKGSTYVQALQADVEKWETWSEIRRVNPLTAISEDFRKRLRSERDGALADTRLKARFLSYRLNVPSGDESTMLLDVADWERMTERETPARDGQPIVGIDLGGGRAWSAAVAVWHTGRVEALALAPGIPDLEAQEKRDHVAGGLYQRLFDKGLLSIAEGLRVQLVGQLWDHVIERWGWPALVVCDRFRLPELEDVIGAGAPIEPRVSRWSEAAFDIRALRKLVKDGPMVVSEDSRLLVAASLMVAHVKNDDQGSFRLVKRDHNNASRDDVAAALALVAGAHERSPKPSETVERREPILV